ncbi:hypothetical protein F4780DRAFT_764215 [Xylariomycetidae sp. FL0641]|nr:hypothetical protein F4780DRAFT_764215 [Xylariomycetidae sp. FL0641]
MEAVAAFGLAVNVMTCVDYGVKVISNAKRLYDSGTESLDPELERDTRHLKQLAQKLDSRQVPAKTSPDQLALDDLATECLDISNRLLNLLEDIKPKQLGSKRSALMASWRMKRRQKDKTALEKRLERCEQRIQDQLAYMMRNEMHEHFQRELASNENVRKSYDILQKDAKDFREALYAVRGISSESFGQVRSLVTAIENAIVGSRQMSILEALRLPTTNERFNDVRDAHEGTFAWLLDDQGRENWSRLSEGADPDRSSLASSFNDHSYLDGDQKASRDLLINWLEKGSGIFHVSGKPGAGKSTLMKFLCSHQKLTRHLRRWAEPSQLVFAKYFFWNPDKSQNTWKSCIRHLVLEILKGSPDLMEVAFPTQWSALESNPITAVSLDDHVVYRALGRLLNATQPLDGKKFVLWIDGLDELAGDHFEIAQTLMDWTTANSALKICVSSREWNIFQLTFRACSAIKLHNITANDIHKLVLDRIGRINTRLGNDTPFTAVKGREKDCLVHDITSRAEGVFLWVRLVLNVVEDAMLNGDGLEEIQNKIKMCPGELEELFDHLLKSIRRGDRQWAFKLTKMAIAFSTSPAADITLYQASFLDDYCHDKNFTLARDAPHDSAAGIEERSSRTRRQVYGRCKGLLEVRQAVRQRKLPLICPERVVLTHRSVVEFLTQTDTAAFMDRDTESFDTFDAICQTFLAQFQLPIPWKDTLFPPIRSRIRLSSEVRDDKVLSYYLRALYYLHLHGKTANPLPWYTFLDNLSIIICGLFPDAHAPYCLHKPFTPDKWETTPVRYIRLAVLLISGQHDHLQWSLGDDAQVFFRERADWVPIIEFILHHQAFYKGVERGELKTLAYCFSQGASPSFKSAKSADCLAWHLELLRRLSQPQEVVENFVCSLDVWLENSLSFIETFLWYGASPDLKLVFDASCGHTSTDEIYSACVRVQSDGTFIRYQGTAGDHDHLMTKVPLPQIIPRKNHVLDLSDIVELWLPENASYLQRLIDRAFRMCAGESVALDENEAKEGVTQRRSAVDPSRERIYLPFCDCNSCYPVSGAKS